MRAKEVFNGTDGEATKAYYTLLNARGFYGQLGVALFRAQKRSQAAKRYGRSKFKGMAYDVKNWSLGEVCRILLSQEHDIVWGWKRDPSTPGYEWVIYVDLPFAGQCSFHNSERLAGPDYPSVWDGDRLSAERIIQFCDSVMVTKI